jgi:large exoprotein involved in heme utilization and adhesion
VSGGGASLVRGGNTLTVNQSTPSAMLNWQSFNVSADGKVNFVQPSSSAVAVNRIFQGSASQIFGSLNAN